MTLRDHPLRWELRALFCTRPAQLGFLAVAVFEVVFVGLLGLDRVRPALTAQFRVMGYDFTEVFSGLTVAQHLVGFAMAGPGALFIALVAAGSIAGNADHGPLRAVLARPTSRLSIWAVKLATCVTYTLAMVVFAAALALALGLLRYGTGPLLVHVPATRGRWLYAFGDGLFLYAWGTVFHAASMLTVTSVAFTLSALPMRGATAALGTVAYLFAEDALRQLPAFASVRGWFVMTYVTSWSRVFDAATDWAWVGSVYAPLLTIDVLVLAGGALVFARRDFTR